MNILERILLLSALVVFLIGSLVATRLWVQLARQRRIRQRSKTHHPAGTAHVHEEAKDSADAVVGPGHELYDMMMLAMEGNAVAAERGNDGEVRITSVRPLD